MVDKKISLAEKTNRFFGRILCNFMAATICRQVDLSVIRNSYNSAG